ncbi:MAG: ParB/Srx family N-terminal domain-containing protein [Pseudomonadota bacterium]
MNDVKMSVVAASETPQIEEIPTDRLKRWKKNARTHSEKQVRQIADSIQEFGFINPVLIDGGGTILAGHGRVAAAKKLGFETVLCVRFDHLSETQKRAYVLAANKLALNAGWDEDLLGEELEALMEIDDGIDLSLTGISFSEIDNLIDGLAPEDEGDPRLL